MYRKNGWMVLALVPVFMIQGCTSKITSSRVTSISPIKPVEGIVYSLPKAEFTVNTSFVITECKLIDKNQLSFKYEELDNVAYSPVSDLSNMYVIDLKEYSKASKESNLEIELHDNGAIKSINSTVEDKTGDIVVDLAKTAGTIALYAAAPEAALTMGVLSAPQKMVRAPEPLPLCTKAVEQAIEARPAAEKALEKAQESVAAQLKAFKTMREQNATDASLNSQYKKLWALNEDLKRKQKIYDDLMADVTISASKTFSDSYSELIEPSDKAFERKINDKDYLPQIKDQLKRRFTVGGRNVGALKQEADGGDAIEGILYRQPTKVQLKICNEYNSLNCALEEEKSIPGIGVLASLPFFNKAFQTNALEAVFNDQGMLTRVKYTANSTAKAMSETAGKLADEYKDYRLGRAEITKAEAEGKLAAIQSQIDLQNKIKQLKQSQVVDTVLDDLNREYELRKIEAEIETLNNDDAIRKMNTELLQMKVEEAKKALQND